MKMNREKRVKWMLAALCCGTVLAWGVTGCAAKAAGAVSGEAVESDAEAVTAAGAEASAGDEAGDRGETAVGSENADGAVNRDEAETDIADQTQDETDSDETAPAVAEVGRVWGQVLSVTEDQITIDNQADTAGQGEVVIQIDPDSTYVLDAVNGFPVQLADVQEGEVIYAYIKPMMTMSLPPIVFAEAVICQVPQDAPAAEYVRVQAMEQQEDESYLLTDANGIQHQVPADCEIIPYLTRNLVRLTDVQQGSTCLIWTDGENVVNKMVLSAD